MKTPTMAQALASPTVSYFTKDILRAAEQKDALDAWRDVQLAADILKVRLDAMLNHSPMSTHTQCPWCGRHHADGPNTARRPCVAQLVGPSLQTMARALSTGEPTTTHIHTERDTARPSIYRGLWCKCGARHHQEGSTT